MKQFLQLALVAFACASAALAQDISKAAEIYNRGLELQQSGNVDAVLLEYERAIALNPKMANAYNNRANIKLSRNDLAGAIADYTKVVELNPKHGLSYFNRGNIHLQQNNTDAAIADFARAIEIFSGMTTGDVYDRSAHVMSYNNRGNALQTKGEYKAALADYDKAFELAPKSFEVFA